MICVFYVFQVCVISHNCQDPRYLSLLRRIVKMKTVMRTQLHQLREPRTCPEKPAPPGQRFANLDLLAIPLIFHRPPWSTLWWEQDKSQQRGRDDRGLQSAGLWSGEGGGLGWMMGVGARERPGGAGGGAELTLAQRAPLLAGPAQRPVKVISPGGQELRRPRRLRKHGWVYAAAELPGADPPTKPACQRAQVTGSAAFSPGTASRVLAACLRWRLWLSPAGLNGERHWNGLNLGICQGLLHWLAQFLFAENSLTGKETKAERQTDGYEAGELGRIGSVRAHFVLDSSACLQPWLLRSTFYSKGLNAMLAGPWFFTSQPRVQATLIMCD